MEESLLAATRPSPPQQELDLSHNHLGRAGVLALARRGGCWSDLRALKLAHNAPPPGGGAPTGADALLALAGAGGPNWPDLEVLTLCGSWREPGAAAAAAAGSKRPSRSGGGSRVEHAPSDGGSDGGSAGAPVGRRSAEWGGCHSGRLSFKHADAGAAAAPLLTTLKAPPQRIGSDPEGRPPPAAALQPPLPAPTPPLSPDSDDAAGQGPHGGCDAEAGRDCLDGLLTAAARAALAEGPAPAARAFLESAGQAWPELRALELPALGRHTLFDSDHERLEEMARRVAPRLSAVNFRQHLHHF